MGKRVKVIETNLKAGRKLETVSPLEFRADKKGNDGHEQNILNVYQEVEYQEILGFGGAFTEATALNFSGLDAAQKQELLDGYFDAQTGLGYNFCRATINSCDFSEDFYSYDDTPEDFALKDFDISHDKKDIIPMILKARELSPQLKLFSSPWSPPGWMKTNGRMDKGGALRNDCRQVWADYFARYIEEYEKAGVDIWGVTVQNEAKAEQGWESCTYEAGEERDFVTGYLKPGWSGPDWATKR